MPRNIDDIEDDDLFGGKSAQDTALRWKFAQLEAAKGMAGMKTFSRFVDEASRNMEKLAASIAGSESLFGPGAGAFSKYQKTIEDQLQQKIKMGNSMASIEGNMFVIADMRLKALSKIAKEEKMTAERRNAIEGTILKELQEQQIHERNLNKSKQLYSQAITKISGMLGGGSMSKAFETWAGKHESSITGKMAGDMGAGTGFGASIEKVASSLSKIAPLMILIGGAVAFLMHRLMGLIEAADKWKSQFIISTGMTGGFEEIFRGRIETSITSLKKGLSIQQVEAQEKTMAAAGALVKQFGDIKGLAGDNITLVSNLAARLGISAEEAAKLIYNLERGAGVGSDKIQPLFANIRALSLEYGVSFNQILQDVGDNSALLKLNVNGTADAFARAAINARLMGTTLESQQQTARGFQTWEGAAEKAVQLTFLTGQRFNALALYTQANYGSSLDMQAQLMRSVRSSFESQSTSRIRKEMIAQQLGLGSAEEMTRRYAAMDAEAKISKELFGKFTKEDISGFRKSGDLEYIRAAIKMEPGLDAKATRERALALKTKAGEIRKSFGGIESTLGLTELTGNTEKILGGILNSIDEVLIPLAQKAVDFLGWIAGVFGFKTEEQRTAEYAEDTKKKLETQKTEAQVDYAAINKRTQENEEAHRRKVEEQIYKRTGRKVILRVKSTDIGTATIKD